MNKSSLTTNVNAPWINSFINKANFATILVMEAIYLEKFPQQSWKSSLNNLRIWNNGKARSYRIYKANTITMIIMVIITIKLAGQIKNILKDDRKL